jgi:hypothetical protein
MPLAHYQVTLGTAATEIVGHDNVRHEALISNNAVLGDIIGLTGSVFLGSSNVSSTNGLKVKAGETVSIRLGPDDRLFAVSSPAGVVVSVLNVRQSD